MNDNILNWNLDPVIFWITETFPLKYYGLFFMAGILIAFYIEKRIYTKENIPIKNLDKLFIYVVVGIFLGARLGHCLFYEPSYYFENPLEIVLPIKKNWRFLSVYRVSRAGKSRRNPWRVNSHWNLLQKIYNKFFMGSR